MRIMSYLPSIFIVVTPPYFCTKSLSLPYSGSKMSPHWLHSARSSNRGQLCRQILAASFVWWPNIPTLVTATGGSLGNREIDIQGLRCTFNLIKPGIVFLEHMSRVARKPAFCICENKDADQLCCNRKADQRLCFHYIASTIPLLPNCEISSL